MPFHVIPFPVPFGQASTYGKRDGCLHGLAVTSKERSNLYKNTRGWKQGFIHGVIMLPRADMFKPDQES